MIERIDVTIDSPNPVYQRFVREHVRRYEIAAEAIREHFGRLGIDDPTIIDCACGYGYGFPILDPCGFYRGFDADWDVIGLARERHPGYFERRVIPDIPIDGADCVVCLETAEHLIDPVGWLRKIRSRLDFTGLLIFSVPTSLTMDFDPFHRRDWDSDRWYRELIEAGFKVQAQVSMPFEMRFSDFVSTVPTTLCQKLRIAAYILSHPCYFWDRLLNWILRNRFYWCSTLYVCVPQ